MHHKKLLLIKNVVFAVPIIIFCCLTYADADGPDYFLVRGVSPGGVLNVRAVPTATGRVVAKISHDAVHLRNVGCSDVVKGVQRKIPDAQNGDVWCKVEYYGVVGWISSRYLMEE